MSHSSHSSRAILLLSRYKRLDFLRPWGTCGNVQIHKTERGKCFTSLQCTFPAMGTKGAGNSRFQPSSYVSRFRNLSNATAGTMNQQWRSATAQFLDRQATKVGSLDTLMWHQAECLLSYWATDQGHEGIVTCFLILDRLVDETLEQPDSTFSLNIYLVHAVLKEWSRMMRTNKTTLSPSQILANLEGYKSQGSTLIQPNIATYTMILGGASHCPNPSERLVFTEKLFARLLQESSEDPDARPTQVTFGAMLNAWCRAGQVDAVARAEALLRQVIEGNWFWIRPNAVLFTSVINGWAKVGDPHRAQKLLIDMYTYYLNDPIANEEAKPNNWSFNAVLTAWSKSNYPEAAKSAEELLGKMNELHAAGVVDTGPDVVSYNCFLNTLVRVRSGAGAIEKADAILQKMLGDGEDGNPSVMPNLITFAALFRVLAANAIEGRDDIGMRWLDLARKCEIKDERYLLDQYHRALERVNL